ncbi:MAG: serine/threonine protein kinase [Deltaproteobacteria bacterium]|nr:serine/threonine protein kinase [Deltaproteobacteria bacterium]
MEDRYLGRYRLLRQIGRGGMASVYHAVQEGPHGFNQEVAIKLVHPDLLRGHPHVLQMLVDEARIAARIKHLNVVRILDLCQDDAGFYMVMDYVDGLSLRHVLDASRQLNRPAPLAPVLDVLAQACDGLEAAHRLCLTDGTPLQLVHRDVKPGNILVSSEGEVKVADFGIAFFTDRTSDQTGHGQMKGTPAYMSPEQALGSSVDRRSDIFSMGMTLYTMATTELPFTGETGTAVALKITQESMEPHAERLDGLLPGFGDLLRRCCAKDADARFGSAAELAVAIRALRETIPDQTSVAEMLASAGWRPWDRSEPPTDFDLPGAAAAAMPGSLLEVSDESHTLSDTPVPVSVAPDVTPGPASPPPQSTVSDDMAGTVVDQPSSAGDVDLEETPVHTRVEVLLPGEGPSKVPRPTLSEDASGPVFVEPRSGPVYVEPRSGPVYADPRTVPVTLSEQPSQVGRRPAPPRPPGMPPGPRPGPPPGSPPGARPDSSQTTGHGQQRRVLPERDYRGRVVQKTVDESAQRVGVAEKVAVGVAAVCVLIAVFVIIKIGMNEDRTGPSATDAVDLDGQVISADDPGTPTTKRPAAEPSPAKEPASASEDTDVPATSDPPAAEAPEVPPETPPETPAPAQAPRPAPPPSTPTPEPTPAPVVARGPGTLTVSTYPWAKVYIDGLDLGRTPLVGHSLEPGQYALRLVVPAAGDKELTETVTIEAGEETRIVRRVSAEEPEPADAPKPATEPEPEPGQEPEPALE